VAVAVVVVEEEEEEQPRPLHWLLLKEAGAAEEVVEGRVFRQ
jgi:hypothetical protein